MFGFYEQEERTIESERPFRPWRGVLSLPTEPVARKLGTNIQKTISRVLVEQLLTQNPIPNTNPALEKLARKYRLGILSNVDNDLLADTMKHFTVSFNTVVTAEGVG